MTRYAMVADLNRCVGCQTCTAACKHTNATPPEIQWRKVLDLEFGEFPDVDRVFMPVGCQHCEDPPCMHVCPSTATGQREDGIVTIDYDLCIGCSYCAVACPYQARYKEDKPTFAYGNKHNATEAIRFDAGRIGVAQKCTFCSDRVDDGLAKGLTPGVDHEATPACVNSCIANALHFGDLEDENSNISKMIKENDHFQMHKELKTNTGFFYLWDRKNKKRKLPENNQFGNVLQKSWDWRAAGNFMFGGTGSSLVFFTALATFPSAPPMALGLLSLVIVAIGLGLVWLEIGRPWRFINVYFNPQTSWMTREASVAVVMFALTLAGVLLRQPLIFLIAGISGLAFLYSQARILKQAKGIPTWRNPAIMPLMITTGLTEGAALLAAAFTLTTSTPVWLSLLIIALLVGRIMTWGHYRNRLAADHAPRESQEVLARITGPYHVLGNIIPAALFIGALLAPAIAGMMILAGSALVVLSGWFFKYNIITRASHVQGYSFGENVPGVPATAH